MSDAVLVVTLCLVLVSVVLMSSVSFFVCVSYV